MVGSWLQRWLQHCQPNIGRWPCFEDHCFIRDLWSSRGFLWNLSGPDLINHIINAIRLVLTINRPLWSGCFDFWGHSEMIMSLLDVGYLDPWGSLSSGLDFLIGWGNWDRELQWSQWSGRPSVNISTGLKQWPLHRIAVSIACLSTHCVFDLWLHCKAFRSRQSHAPENRVVCTLWSLYPQDPNYWSLFTGTTPTLWSPTLINTSLCGSMSFSSDTWGFRHMRLFICAWLPILRLLWWVSTEEARDRSMSRGCRAWCLWSAMANRQGYDALVTQECGDLVSQWGFPTCGHIQAVVIVQRKWRKFGHRKVCIPIKFH